jgi:hypothetical protein
LADDHDILATSPTFFAAFEEAVFFLQSFFRGNQAPDETRVRNSQRSVVREYSEQLDIVCMQHCRGTAIVHLQHTDDVFAAKQRHTDRAANRRAHDRIGMSDVGRCICCKHCSALLDHLAIDASGNWNGASWRASDTRGKANTRHDGNVCSRRCISTLFVVTQDDGGMCGHWHEKKCRISDFDEDLIEIDCSTDALLRGVEFAKTIWILFDGRCCGHELIEGPHCDDS